MDVIEYVPKWKWFKPPLWRCFRWAYNINVIKQSGGIIYE